MKKITTTAIVALLLIFSNQLFSQLSGTYTIGVSNSDYTTISSAITDLTTNGISDNVIFNIKEGVYTEQLLITEAIAGSNTFNILFQSELLDTSKVKINFSNPDNESHLVELTLINNLSFNFLTFELEANYKSRIFKLNHGIINLKITNCALVAKNRDIHHIELKQPTSSENPSTGIVINNNKLENGYLAIELEGGYFGMVTNIEIENNIITNQKSHGIALSSVENLIVKSNTITTIESTYNAINNYGIGIEYGKDFEICNNKIYSTFGSGIRLYNCQNESNLKKTISNNFVTTQITSMGGQSIILNDSENIDIIFNTFRVIGINTGWSNQAGLFSGNTNINLINNIFYSNDFYAINIDGVDGILNCNYNLFRGAENKLASINYTTISDLETWKTTTNLDANSVTGEINFISESDLHIKSTLVDSMGMVWTGITTDIDGDTRNTTKPDIGADEFEIINTVPVIENQEFSLNENPTIDFEIGIILASDADTDQTLTYSLIDGDHMDAFVLDSLTGSLKVAMAEFFNFEEVSATTLTVKVEDNGEVSQCNTAEITININDVNETPIASNETFQIYENSSINDTVGVLAASDPDNNQQLAYTITEGNLNDAFAINSETGVITVNKNDLDFEMDVMFTLTINVADNGTNQLDTDATITIELLNVNEPVHIEDLEININENPFNDSEIGNVIVSDDDFPFQYPFNNEISIIEGNDDGIFSIEPYLGTLYVADSTLINYEVNTSLTIKVQVTDGEFYDTATVIINITDVIESSVNSMLEQAINVYPNPSNGEFTINGLEQTSRIEFYTISGKMITSENIDPNKTSICIENYSGIIIAKIYTNSTIITKRFVIE